MSNLTETPVYRTGVFQLETTTPVRGGAAGESNTPLQDLADRTAYLKAHVDALETAITLLAPLASPPLSGTPTSTTPNDGDSSTQIPTTAWVQALMRGQTSKTITGGSVILTAIEAGKGALVFSGALTSNAIVSLPSGTTGRWAAVNRTSGAFTLEVRTLGTTGVTIGQGRSQLLWSDGTNMAAAVTEAESLSLTGVPTAPTASPSSSGSQVASLDYARRFARGAAAINCSAGGTITPTDIQAANPVITLTGSPAGAFVLAVPSEAADWVVINSTAQSVTVKTAGQAGGYTISAGRWALIFTDGTIARSAPGETRGQDLRDTPTSDTPDASAASRETVNAAWVRQLLAGQSFYTTGDFKLTFKAAPEPGWLFLAGGSIGSAASGATTRANADTAALYSLFWANLPDSAAPVTGGRGASATADFVANKPLTMPDFRGRAPIGAGLGSGLTQRDLGSVTGSETTTLSIAQMPQHDHGGATGLIGDHIHGAAIAGDGYHSHNAWTGGSGAHGHSASSDLQGEHAHGGAIIRGLDNIGGVEEGRGSPDFSISSMDSAGNHAHNINVGAVGDHSHGVGIEAGGTHTHGVTIGGAGGHQHSISAQGAGSAHANMQPSLAVNVMVKL